MLLEYEARGLRFFNRPSSVLRCHRHRLVRALMAGSIAFPASLIVRTDAPLSRAALDGFADLGSGPIWLKRGDVHAERPEDVRLLCREALHPELARFKERGIPLAVLQANVEGPVLKFYGIMGRRLFYAYFADSHAPLPPGRELDEISALAFRAAARLRLDIFGGDVVLTEGKGPVLIDLNDWPSFAPIRERAGRTIAEYAHAHRLLRVVR